MPPPTGRHRRATTFIICTASSHRDSLHHLPSSFMAHIAATGFGVCLTITSPLTAIIGFAILSAGMACVNPSTYTFAGNQQDLTASEGSQ
jgi:hypothetical protein